jgi:hypothetical protein
MKFHRGSPSARLACFAKFRSPLFLLALSVALLAGCTNFDDQVKDESKLEGPARGDLGRRLVVQIDGTTAELAERFSDGVKAELEGGDLFDEVAVADSAPLNSTSVSARLDLTLISESHGILHDFWRQRDGYYERYELACSLTERGGKKVLEGQIDGIGYDDKFDCGPLAAIGFGWFGNPDRIPESLSEDKKEDIRTAARRDAVQKVARSLQAAANEKARDALKALVAVHLPPGVGPLPIAVLGFDDDPAARHRRGVPLARAVASDLQHLGPDFAVVSQDEVEQEVGADPSSRPKSFQKIRSDELDRLVPRLGARLYVLGTVSADGNRVEATAWVKTSRLETVGEPARAVAEGPGALARVAVDLAQKLGTEVEKHPPDALPKKEESE